MHRSRHANASQPSLRQCAADFLHPAHASRRLAPKFINGASRDADGPPRPVRRRPRADRGGRSAHSTHLRSMSHQINSTGRREHGTSDERTVSSLSGLLSCFNPQPYDFSQSSVTRSPAVRGIGRSTAESSGTGTGTAAGVGVRSHAAPPYLEKESRSA